MSWRKEEPAIVAIMHTKKLQASIRFSPLDQRRVRSKPQFTSESLLLSLPVFSHNSSEENVDSDNLDAPLLPFSLQSAVLCMSDKRTKFYHMLVEQFL